MRHGPKGQKRAAAALSTDDYQGDVDLSRRLRPHPHEPSLSSVPGNVQSEPKAFLTPRMTLTGVKSLSDPSLVNDLDQDPIDLEDRASSKGGREDDLTEVSMAKQEDLDEEEMREDDEEEEEEEVEETILGEKVKSSTLPSNTRPPAASAAKLRILTQLKKTNSLKRSMTLLKNPFSASSVGQPTKMDLRAKKAKSSKSNKDNAGESEANSQKGELEKNPTASPALRGDTSSTSQSVWQMIYNLLQWQPNAKALGKYGEVSEERQAELRRRFEEGKIPGVIGIKNHGNTCFINAILQCLSFTDTIAAYFVLDRYKMDLRRKKRVISALRPSFNKSANGNNKGEVTEQLATLLKSLWSLQYDSEISQKFKNLVDKHASQYKGSSQHDAQEFLLWLLDQVHEELNQATKRKYKASSKGSDQNPRPDHQLAAEALLNYQRCNNSFVIDVFQAQFRSSLTCPKCERQSNTFDPFLCVSLPIPQKQMMPVFVTVLYIDQTPRQVKLGLTIGVHETIGELRRMLAKDTGIETEQMLLTEIGSLGFDRTLRDSLPVTTLKEGKDPLFCIEMPKHKNPTQDDGAFVVLTWVNLFKEGPREERFGSPYAIQVSRETEYADLQKLLLKEMSPILHDDILISAQKVPLFKIKVLDGFSESAYLDSTMDLPMYSGVVDQALNACSAEVGGGQAVPAHIKMILEWDMPAKSQIVNDDSNVIEEHSSVKDVEKGPEEASSVTLQECFGLYTSAETLGDGNAWLCPACNRKQQVVKKMGLWSVPDVLVVHLKRFRQSSSSANKLSTMVDFPLTGFDMTPNVAKPSDSEGAEDGVNAPPSENSGGALKVFNLSHWRNGGSNNSNKRFQTPRGLPDDYNYDLYAVCNHHGTDLQGGHYTASCRNPTDGQWYNFDDQHTKPIPEEEVVTQEAYILFYQKRSTSLNPPSLSSASSSASSSSSSNQEHWVFRMPDFTYKKKTGSLKPTTPTSPSKKKAETKKAAAATTTTTTASSSSSSTPTTEKKKEEEEKEENKSSFQRNGVKYATLPPKRTSEVIDCEPDHCSDIEQIDSEDEEEEESSEENTVKEEDEDDDGISRPIDKNDVD